MASPICWRAVTASPLRRPRQGAAERRLPAVSTGVYGYPLPRAAEVATGTVAAFLDAEPRAFDRILFVCFSTEAAAIFAETLEPLSQ